MNSEYGIRDLLLFAVKPMSPYWYLWVLAIYYALILIVKKEINKYITVAIGLFISIASSFICTGFSETPKNVLFFAIAFILGLNFDVLIKLISKNYLAIISCVTIILFCIFQFYKPTEFEDIPVVGVFLGVILSLSVMCIISQGGILYKSALLRYLGKNSLEIYVLHCFITAPLRKVLMIVGIKNLVLCVSLSTIIAIALSLIVQLVLKKMHLYSFKPPVYKI